MTLAGVYGGAARVGHYSFAAGPDLTVLAAPIAVDVGTEELFRIPRLCAGVSVSGAADLFR